MINALACTMASPAEAMPGPINVRVFGRVGMAARALRGEGSPQSSPGVLANGHGFQVRDTNAGVIAAQMIEDHAFRHGPDKVVVGPTMGKNTSAIEREFAVTLRVCAELPKVTTVGVDAERGKEASLVSVYTRESMGTHFVKGIAKALPALVMTAAQSVCIVRLIAAFNNAWYSTHKYLLAPQTNKCLEGMA